MKEKILARLQELRDEDLTAAEFAAERSVALMQAYCNREDLPEELLSVGVALAGMLLDEGVTKTTGRAKSIKEGDISVTFAEDAFDGDTEKLLRCFKTELDRFRRLDW